jgi:hypothetical protein
MFQDCDVSGNLLQQYEQHHESTLPLKHTRFFYATQRYFHQAPISHLSVSTSK